MPSPLNRSQPEGFSVLVPGLLSLSLLTHLSAQAAGAQTVRGRLIEEGTDSPIPGALIVLLGEEGKTVGQVLTGEDGRFLVAAPAPGRYRVRADRIGYQSASSEVLTLARGDTVDYRLAAPVQAVDLGTLPVEVERRCVVRPAEGLRTAMLWEEVRKALAVTKWTEDERPFLYEIRHYERQLDAQTMVVLRERSDSHWAAGGKPFHTPSAEELLERGFVRFAPGDSAYYAPDAEVLLSDAFVATHCFRVKSGEDDRAGLIGLAFEPARARRGADVEGVLWVDAKTAELRYLDYAYTSLRISGPAPDFGGRLDFERLPTGHWIVRRWRIRAPIMGVTRPWWRRDERLEVVAGIKEEGGEVVQLASATAARRVEARPAAPPDEGPSPPALRAVSTATRALGPASVECGTPSALSASLRASRDRVARAVNVDSVRALHEETERSRERDDSLALVENGFVALRLYDLTQDNRYAADARRSLEHAVRDHPSLAWGHYGLALSLVRAPVVRPITALSRSQARRALRRALELDPSFGEAALLFGEVALELRGRDALEEARDGLRRALETCSGAARLYLLLADVEAGLGDVEASAWAARAALAAGAETAAGLYRLGVALLRTAGGEEEGARAYFAAVDQLTPALAERVYEDLFPIVSPTEAKRWETADLEGRRQWLVTFWEKRAALAAVTVRERLAEHYRRLAIAYERYRRIHEQGPPPAGALLFEPLPGVRWEPFDDRGLVFVRHGEPQEVIRSFGAHFLPNETWVYRAPDGRTEFFNFVTLPYGSGVRLVDDLFTAIDWEGAAPGLRVRSIEDLPNLPAEKLLLLYDPPVLERAAELAEERARLQPRYFSVASRLRIAKLRLDCILRPGCPPPGPGMTLESRVADLRAVLADARMENRVIRGDLRLNTLLALERDAHRPRFERELPFHYHLVTFQGDEGRTDITAAIAIPADRLEPTLLDGDTVYALRLSLIVVDTAEDRITRKDTTQYFRAPRPLGTGEYLRTHVDLSAEPSEGVIHRLVVLNAARPGDGQVYGGPAEVPDYARTPLLVSDIVLAEPDSAGPWRRHEVQLALVPPEQFEAPAPFTVFYEVYNLPATTPYRTEIAVERAEGRSLWGKLKGLFGGGRPLRLRFEAEAKATPDGRLQEVRRVQPNLKPGRYRIRVTVTNLLTGESAVRDRQFAVME